MRVRMVALAAMAAVAVSLVTAVPSGQRASASGDGSGRAPGVGAHAGARTGDVIARFKQDASFAGVAAALGSARTAAAASTPGSRLVLLRPESGQSVDAALAALRARPDVEFAEADTVVSAVATPTDPSYAPYQWNLPQIGLPTAWNTTTGSASVIVAVLDTGVDASHPDLTGKITTGANAGWNFVANNSNTADDHSHGTFVAGIIAANTNNGQGGAGVCWACKIMPVKVLDSSGNGTTFNVAQGIDWAVSHGAKVVNLSLGGGASAALQTSVDNAWNAGVIVVAAAGNNAGNADTSDDGVLYPAAYANAIAVGANDSSGARSAFSNYGPELDLMAPGQGVFSTLCTCGSYSGGYGLGDGTSFAAPHVAGVVALMISAGITDKNVIRQNLINTATDMGPAGFDNNTGYGRVNAALAVLPSYGVTWGANTLPSSMAAGATANVTVSFTNAGSAAWPAGGGTPVRFSYHWKNGACPGTTTAVFDGVRTALAADVAPGGSVAGLNASIAAPPSAGTYCLQYDLVREGVTWFSWAGAAVQSGTVTVTAPVYGVSWGANTLPSSVAANSATNVNVTFTNSGSLTWASGGANPVRLGYHWHSGACPPVGATDYTLNRSALASNVAPGGTVTNLALTLNAPSTPGTYCLVYDLVREGITWFSWQGASTQTATVTVTAPQYQVTWGANTMPSSMPGGSTSAVSVSFTNAGALTWSSGGANPVRLGYHWHSGACPPAGATDYTLNRSVLPGDIAPGGSVSGLSLSVTAPSTPGTYCLVYDLVREGVTWFSWQKADVQTATVTVTTPQYAVAWGAHTTPSTMTASSANNVTISFTNSGTLTWSASGTNPVRLSYHWKTGACPGTTTAVFDGVRTALAADVAGGGSVSSLSATVQAPASAGTYCLQYDLVREGITWFSWQGASMLSVTVTVT